MGLPLYCFTTAYPFSKAVDWTFIHPQVEHLRRVFDPVVFFPYYKQGELGILPEGIKVDLSFLDLRKQRVVNPLNWLGMCVEVVRHGECNCLATDLRRIIVGGMTIRAVARWVRRFARQNPEPAMFYTTALSPVTLGLCRGLSGHSGKIVVSRCIGGDVREDQHPNGRIPYINAMVGMVDWLFPVSSYLRSYLSKKFPDMSGKVTINYNGVTDMRGMVPSSSDGILRILSCGMMVPLKRYDLLAKGLVELAKLVPGRQFEWRHMLLGALDAEVESILQKGSPKNLKTQFITGVRDVRLHYQKQKIDLMVHVSRSEGFSMAVAEALSCGIPVLATDCGGMADMVDDSVGRLIPNDIEPCQLADFLWDMLKEPEKLSAMKDAARSRWQQVANADRNYLLLAESMAALAQGGTP